MSNLDDILERLLPSNAHLAKQEIKIIFHTLVSESYQEGSHTLVNAETLNSKIEAL